jgi:hypothetical protein
MNRCPSCGAEVQDKWIACPTCGADLKAHKESVLPAMEGGVTEATPPPEAPVKRRPAKLEHKFLLFILASIVTAILLLVNAVVEGSHGIGFYVGVLLVVVFWVAFLVMVGRVTRYVFLALALLVGAYWSFGQLKEMRRVHQEKRQQAEQVAAAKRAEEEARAAALMRLSQLKKDLSTAMTEQRWEDAAKIYAEAQKIKADEPELKEAWAKIDPQMQKIAAAREDEKRRKTVAEGIEDARKVINDPERCDTPAAISDAWNKLRLVRKEDAQWAEARNLAGGLEKCRKRTERTLSKNLQDIMIAQRKQIASNLERTFWDQGINVEVKLAGSNKDRVTFQWALMSRAAVHQLTSGGSMKEGSVLANLQKTGFRRVTFSDGFDDSESWYYDLNPPDETKGGQTTLQELGLGEPLELAVTDATRTSGPGPAAADLYYVNPGGEAYHRPGCKFIAADASALPLAQAAAGRRPCRTCRPSVIGEPTAK